MTLPLPRPRPCSESALYVSGVPRRVCRCHPDRWWQPTTARPSLRLVTEVSA